MPDRCARLPHALLAVWLAAWLPMSGARALAQTPTSEPQRQAGRLSGQLVDEVGTPIAAATAVLLPSELAPIVATAGPDGRFLFPEVPAGSFRLTLSAPGFATQTLQGVVEAGVASTLPPLRLTLALGTIDVDVTQTRIEIAEQQLKEETQQRVLGVFPNFRVSYRPDAVPLTGRQKFKLTWKSISDPTRFASAAVIAGIQQARGDFSGFGDGAEGYARRYAAFYGTAFTATMISNALLPALFKQDPRYFYKGTGSASSRAGYALSRAFLRKGDNGRWQPDFSRILGSLASGAISNLYYPSEDRRSARLTFENTALGLGGAAIGNLMQEFVLGRLTTRARKPTPPPQPAQ